MVSVCSQWAHAHAYTHAHPHTCICIYIRIWLAALIDTGRKHSTHANTNSTNGLILFPSLANQDRSSLMENKYVFVYIYTILIPPVSGLRRSSYSVADPWIPSLPSCWHLEMLSPEAHSSIAVAGIQTYAQTRVHVCASKHTHTQTQTMAPSSSSWS